MHHVNIVQNICMYLFNINRILKIDFNLSTFKVREAKRGTMAFKIAQSILRLNCNTAVMLWNGNIISFQSTYVRIL